jgi:hypothetical protein
MGPDLPVLYQWLPVGRGNFLLETGVVPTPDGFTRMFADPSVATVLVADSAGTTAGAFMLSSVNGQAAHGQVGVLLAPGVPVRAIARAAAGFVDHVFSRLPLNKLCVNGPEPVFRELQQLFGPALCDEGRLRDYLFADGAYRDAICGSILRREWDSRDQGESGAAR